MCLAFALGLKLFADKHTIKQFVISLSIFVISCPVGIGIGMVVVQHFTDDTLTKVVFVLKALATGKLLLSTFDYGFLVLTFAVIVSQEHIMGQLHFHSVVHGGNETS